MDPNWHSDPYRRGPPGYDGHGERPFWQGGNWQQPPPYARHDHNVRPGPGGALLSAEFYAPDPRLLRAPPPPPPPPPPQPMNFHHVHAPPPSSIPMEVTPHGPPPPFRHNQQFESDSRGGRGRGGRGRHSDISNNPPRQQFGGRGRHFGPPPVNQEQFHPKVEQNLNYREVEEPLADPHDNELIEEHGPFFWRRKDSPPGNHRTPVKADSLPDFPNIVPEAPQERDRPNFVGTRGQGRYFDAQVLEESPAISRTNPVRDFEAHPHVGEQPTEDRKFIPLDATQDFMSVSTNSSRETNTREINCRFPSNREAEKQDVRSTSLDIQPGTSGHQFSNPRAGQVPKKSKRRKKNGRGGLNSGPSHPAVGKNSFEKRNTPQDTSSRNKAASSEPSSASNPPERTASSQALNVDDNREVTQNSAASTVPNAFIQEGSVNKDKESFAEDFFPANFEFSSSAPRGQPVSLIPGLDAPQTQEVRSDLQEERVRSIVEASQAVLDSMPDISAVRRMLQTLDSEDEDSFPEAIPSNSAKPSTSGQKTSASFHSSKNPADEMKSHLPGSSSTQRSYVRPASDRLPNPPPPPSLSAIRSALEASNLRLSDLSSFLAQENTSDRPSAASNPPRRQLQPPNSDLRLSPVQKFSEFSRDTDLRTRQLLSTPVQGNDNLSGPFRDTGHLSEILASLIEERGTRGGIRQTVSNLRLPDSERSSSGNFGARDFDMREPRLLDALSSRMDVDHRELLFDRRAGRGEEFGDRDLESRLSPVSPPVSAPSGDRRRSSRRSWGGDDLDDRTSRSPRSLTPSLERDDQERWEEPLGELERITTPEEELPRVPRTRSRSPVLHDALERRSPSPFRHGRREGSPLSPRRRHSRRYSRSRSGDRSPRRVRSRYSRSPRGNDHQRISRRRRSSPSPRRFHHRSVSRSPPGNGPFRSRSRSRSPHSFRSHNSRHRSRTPPFRSRRVSPGAGSRGERRDYRSRSPGLRRERTPEPEVRAAYPVSSFIEEPPSNLPYYEHSLPAREMPLTHSEPQFMGPPMTNVLYSVPPPNILAAVQVIASSVVPNGSDSHSIPVLAKSVQTFKPGVKGRPNLCVINTSNRQELSEVAPVLKPVEVIEVNPEEEEKKRLQELKEKRRARAQAQRVEFAAKHEKLMQELLRLKSQNAELTIKQMKMYGERDVERLSLLIMENGKLQSALTKQIRTIGGVVKKLDRVLQNKETIRFSSGKNFKFFDPQNHWCEICKEFFGDLRRYLEHCHSTAHKKIAKQKPVDGNDELPWSKETSSTDSQVPDTTTTPPQALPFDGVQFLVPVEAMYCKLCNEFMGDAHCALRHVNSSKHHDAYLEYITSNPDWEYTWVEARQTAFKEFIVEQKAKADLKVKEEAERKKKLDEQRAQEYETFVKREESQRGNVEELDDNDQGTTTSEGQKNREIRVNVRANLKN